MLLIIFKLISPPWQAATAQYNIYKWQYIDYHILILILSDYYRDFYWGFWIRHALPFTRLKHDNPIWFQIIIHNSNLSKLMQSPFVSNWCRVCLTCHTPGLVLELPSPVGCGRLLGHTAWYHSAWYSPGLKAGRCHYLSQCRAIINEALWNLSEHNHQEMLRLYILDMSLDMGNLILLPHLSGPMS